MSGTWAGADIFLLDHDCWFLCLVEQMSTWGCIMIACFRDFHSQCLIVIVKIFLLDPRLDLLHILQSLDKLMVVVVNC